MHTGIYVLISITGLVVSDSPAVIVLIGAKIPCIRHIQIVFIIKIIFKRCPQIMIPIFGTYPVILINLVYFVFQCMPGINIHIFHLFYITCTIHYIKSHFGSRQPKITVHTSTIEIMVRIISIYFSLKRIIIRTFQHYINDSPSYMILGGGAIHYFCLFHTINRSISQ